MLQKVLLAAKEVEIVVVEVKLVQTKDLLMISKGRVPDTHMLGPDNKWGLLIIEPQA